MNDNKGICDPDLISRFFDHELDQKASERIAGHIEKCPSCRRTLEDFEGLSLMVNEQFRDIRTELTKGSVEEAVLAALQNRKVSWRSKIRETLLSKKMLIPLTTSAVLIVSLAVFFHSPKPAGPSAIVTSLSGEMTSVIIMETPQTHQTILWYTEDSDHERPKL